MGSMQSPVDSIESHQFLPMPKKPVHGRVVKVGNVILMRGDHGALYTNIQQLGRKIYCAGRWEFSDDMTEALDKLGMLTPEHKALHKRWLHKLADESAVTSAISHIRWTLDEKPNRLSAATIRRLKAEAVRLWDSLDAYAQSRHLFHGGKIPDGASQKPDPKPAAG